MLLVLLRVVLCSEYAGHHPSGGCSRDTFQELETVLQNILLAPDFGVCQGKGQLGIVIGGAPDRESAGAKRPG